MADFLRWNEALPEFMIPLLGFITIVSVLALIMAKKVAPVVALIVVPVITAIIGGFGPDVGRFVAQGIAAIAPTGVMFIFAILFFSVLTDAGTFRPLIKATIKFGGSDPVKIAVGTAIFTFLAHLDGAGATTFLVVIPPMLILYNAVGMRPTTLATIVALGAGTMNAVPWSAVPLRAATILSTPGNYVSSAYVVSGILVPLGAGLLLVVGIAYFLGTRERKRLGYSPNTTAELKLEKIEEVLALSEDQKKLLRPKMVPLNACMILVTVVILMMGWVPAHITFMVAFSLALIINYPVVADQRARIDAHAKSALMMATVLFGAAVLIGITRNSGMIESMTAVAVNIIPDAMGRYLPVIVGVLAMPLSLLFDPDSFYFGVLPVLVQVSESFGVDGINVVRAALLGQMTTGFPVSPLTPSTFLLVGLAGVDFGEHQKKTIPFAFTVTIFMLIVSLVTGAIRLS